MKLKICARKIFAASCITWAADGTSQGLASLEHDGPKSEDGGFDDADKLVDFLDSTRLLLSTFSMASASSFSDNFASSASLFAVGFTRWEADGAISTAKVATSAGWDVESLATMVGDLTRKRSSTSPSGTNVSVDVSIGLWPRNPLSCKVTT